METIVNTVVQFFSTFSWTGILKSVYVNPVNIIWVMVYIVGLIWFTWFWFIAMMALQAAREQDRLTTMSKVFGYPILAVGIVADWMLQQVSTLIFLEAPRMGEWLFTARMKRYYNRTVIDPNRLERWRKWAGTKITEGLLNNISESVGVGKHV